MGKCSFSELRSIRLQHSEFGENQLDVDSFLNRHLAPLIEPKTGEMLWSELKKELSRYAKKTAAKLSLRLSDAEVISKVEIIKKHLEGYFMMWVDEKEIARSRKKNRAIRRRN